MKSWKAARDRNEKRMEYWMLALSTASMVDAGADSGDCVLKGGEGGGEGEYLHCKSWTLDKWAGSGVDDNQLLTKYHIYPLSNGKDHN
jgi:hypothetical protein